MKTINDAINYVHENMDKQGVGVVMAKVMLENIQLALLEGKTIHDEIEFK